MSKISKSDLSTRRLLVILDIFCLFLAAIPLLVIELKLVSPIKRGFICGDTSIVYPFMNNETISNRTLIIGGVFFTGLILALGECYRVRFLNVRSNAFVRNLYVSSLYKELGSFLFGCCIGQSFTNMAKVSIGRLRPHFLFVCGITYDSINCTPGTYVESVTCPKNNHRLEEEARKSFYSGHASFAMYSMVYLVFYLQARLTWHGARLVRPALQFCLIFVAVYTGLSRITDYRHHPSDVIAGYIQGAVTAYFVACHHSSMFKNYKNSQTRSSLSSTNQTNF